MKLGFRVPSLSKTFKSRTTGSIKRSVKNSYNPLYGTSGIGFVKNPKKSVYNKVYKKISFDIFKIFR